MSAVSWNSFVLQPAARQHSPIKLCSPASPFIASPVIVLYLTNKFLLFHHCLARSVLLEWSSIFMGFVNTMILLMHWAYWTLSVDFPSPVSLSFGGILAFIKESSLSRSQRIAGTQGPGALCKVIKLWAEEPLKCVSKNHGKYCSSHFSVYSMALGFGVGSAVNVIHKPCSEQLLAWDWIVCSSHRKITRRQQKSLKKASYNGFSLLEG